MIQSMGQGHSTLAMRAWNAPHEMGAQRTPNPKTCNDGLSESLRDSETMKIMGPPGVP